MATFEATQGMRVQYHFEVLEVDLPVITGTCTIGAALGTGTPLTCDQPWVDEYKTYYFTNENAPLIPSINGEPVYRCITKINESTTELKPSEGLSSRGSLNVTFIDFNKQDPNTETAGVTEEVKNNGTFFGKLKARQIFENKTVRLKLYRVQEDGSIDLVNGAQTRHYVANTFSTNSKGVWNLACKDVLSLANVDEKTWPVDQGGFLRQGINNSTQSIPVDEFVDYSAVEVVRIGDEFFNVLSVTDNLTPTAILNTGVRGGDVVGAVSGEVLTKSRFDDHSAGDEVFVCVVSDDETIDSLLTRILVDCDFDIALIPAAEWAAEVAEWHANDKINTVHSESESANSAINRVLTGFLMDLWFSTTDNLAKLSAISVWKESTASLIEGKEINAYTVKKIAKESMRATRSLVVYDKRYLADPDETTSYKKASSFKDDTLVSAALFSEHKDKHFDNNFLLGTDAAALLTQRYVSRFKFTPYERTWVTDEKNLTFKAGDVVDLNLTVDQGLYGLPSGNVRAQITKINPKYSKAGRSYNVKALAYEAAFESGSEIVLNSPLNATNLYITAGAPAAAVDVTFILDGTYSFGETSFRAGAFPVGSKLTIILANGFDGQANGGRGGQGQDVYRTDGGTPIFGTAKNGLDGGVVYDAQGVDTDIYFSGATPSVAYPVADGYIRAPSGGEGGLLYTGSNPNLISGNGGNGGDGRSVGVGGLAGSIDPAYTQGVNGSNGNIDGSGSGWGVDGINNAATGGLKGSGIIDSGATVTLYGDTPARYINGAGDH